MVQTLQIDEENNNVLDKPDRYQSQTIPLSPDIDIISQGHFLRHGNQTSSKKALIERELQEQEQFEVNGLNSNNTRMQFRNSQESIGGIIDWKEYEQQREDTVKLKANKGINKDI